MPRKAVSGSPSRKSIVVGRLWRSWSFVGPLAGFVLGCSTSEEGIMGSIFSQYAMGRVQRGRTLGSVTTVASGTPQNIENMEQENAAPTRDISQLTASIGLDLPHLKNCDKPQSNRTLQEMAYDYQPTKFYGFLHANYDRFYPRYMEKYRTKHFRMLEIGLDDGKSSLLWQEYFPCATLVGLELDITNTQNEGVSKIQAIVGDQANSTFLRTDFLRQTNGGNFDLIIDDGGHHYEQQSASYEALFELALNPGGLYVIEDIETSFWQPGIDLYHRKISRGGVKEPNNIINKFKEVVHVVNKKFHDNTFVVFGQVDQLISTISFGSNVIFMEKKTRDDCWNERPYMWPHVLANDSPAKQQALDANKGSLIHKFCDGIDIFLRDAVGQMRNGGTEH